MPYAQGPYPTLDITAPSSAPVNKTFTISAGVANPNTAWTYTWVNRTTGCAIAGTATTTTSTTLTASCDNSVVNKFASFSVTATRTADGETVTDTRAVKIISSGAPVVSLAGPSVVTAGTTATFTATVTNASSPTYQWYSAMGWSQGTGASVTVAVPATATGTDTLYLTVTSATGEQTTAQFAYSVEPAFAMTLNGPDRLVSGRTGTFTVTPNRAVQVQWSSNQVACPFVPDADNQNTARLTCAADFDGTVQVTAVGVHDGQTLTRTKSIPVAPTPIEVLRNTTVNLTVSGNRYPTTFTVALKDQSTGKGIAYETVTLEFRTLTGTYSRVTDIQLDRDGAASFQMAVDRGGYYRVTFGGTDTFGPSVAAERRQLRLRPRHEQGDENRPDRHLEDRLRPGHRQEVVVVAKARGRHQQVGQREAVHDQHQGHGEHPDQPAQAHRLPVRPSLGIRPTPPQSVEWSAGSEAHLHPKQERGSANDEP